MRSIAKKEIAVLVVLALVVAIGLYPALRYARREVRDGIRRTEVIEDKVALEQYFNEFDQYPLEYDASPHVYVVTEDDGQEALAWYVRAQLENSAEEEAAFDYEHNVFYRVVNVDGSTYFDVCGGTSTCGASRDDE